MNLSRSNWEKLQNKVQTEYVNSRLRNFKIISIGTGFGIKHDDSIWIISPKSFVKSLSKLFIISDPILGVYPIDIMFNTCVRLFDRDTKLYVNKTGIEHAIALLDAEADPITYEASYDLFGRLCDDGVNVSSFNGDEISSHFIVNSNDKIKIPRLIDGVYKLGYLVNVGHLDRSNNYIAATLDHGWNKIPITNRSCKIMIPPNESIESTLRSLLANKESEFRGIIADRLLSAKATTASIKECIETGDLIIEVSNNVLRANEINLDEVGNIPRRDVRKNEWVSKKSSMNRLQLFNLLIDTYANNESFYDFLGAWLFKPGYFENGIKIHSKRLVLGPDDDIASKVENSNRPRGIYDTKEL